MKKLLLHCCCGPCASAVVERLKNQGEYDMTLYYFNPNIYPEKEFELRAQQVIKVAKYFGIKYIITDKIIDFTKIEKDLHSAPEGGARCSVCFEMRLGQTAQFAKQNDYDIFATTLTVSPHKNAQLINKIGEQISAKTGIQYLSSDFKKQNGYLRSLQLSKQLDLYRQNYCGCIFSCNQEKF